MHAEDEGPRGQNAPRSGAGRGVAYWSSADGSDQRIIYVTPGYRMIALNARTGVPVADLRPERRRRSEARQRSGARSRHRRARPECHAARRRRRRRRRRGAALQRRRRRRCSNAQGLRPRLRRQDRQAAVDLPHHPEARRVRLRHLGERLGAEERQHRRVGADERRPRARPGLRAGRDADRRLLRRQPARQHAVRREPRRARHQDRQAEVALPDRPSRRLGLRPAVRADPVRHDRERPARQGAGAADQAGVPVRPQSRDRRADLADRRAAGAAVDRARREDQPDAALPHQAGAIRSAGHRRSTT